MIEKGLNNPRGFSNDKIGGDFTKSTGADYNLREFTPSPVQVMS